MRCLEGDWESWTYFKDEWIVSLSTVELFCRKLQVARLGNLIVGEGTTAEMIEVQKLSRRVNLRGFSKAMLNRKWVFGYSEGCERVVVRRCIEG